MGMPKSTYDITKNKPAVYKDEEPTTKTKKAPKAAAVANQVAAGRGRPANVWGLVPSAKSLRSWREDNNLSRAALAASLHVSPTSIQNWETEHAIPGNDFQAALAQLMASPGNVGIQAPSPGKAPKATKAPKAASSVTGDLNVVGNIVTSFLARGTEPVTVEKLAEVIATVRKALT